jgi:hypothetical protein
MTIEELLMLESKRSSVEGFFTLLYDQSIDSAFNIFSSFNICYRSLEGVSVYLIEVNGANYFKLCFLDAPFLIYKVEENHDIRDCWLIDFELYKAALRSCVKAVNKKYIPVKDKNEKIS